MSIQAFEVDADVRAATDRVLKQCDRVEAVVPIRVVCCWCGVVITEGRLRNGHPSGGMCPRCCEQEQARLDAS